MTFATPRHATVVALLAAALAACLSACGARVGAPNLPSLDGGDPVAGSDGGPRCNAQYPCPTAGLGQCVRAQISRCVDDGAGCLEWTEAMDCGPGLVCVDNACVDVCTTPGLMAACTQAAENVANCCGGSLPAPMSAADVCHALVKKGLDPAKACAGFTLQTTCDTVRTMLVGAGGCCCPTDFVCDAEKGNRCAAACVQRTGCNGDPGGSVCCPSGNGGLVVGPAYLCRPDDGKPLHGCRFVANNGCDSGYDCWRDRQNNQFCTRSCNVDADCQNPGVACCNMRATCNRLIGNCGGAGACMPC